MRTLTMAWLADGVLQQYTITAGQSCVIGREAARCQIILADRSVSRQHASISIFQGRFCLKNLSEQNPIILNNQSRLAYNQETPLKAGDTFRLGTIYLWVMEVQQPEQTILKVKCARCGKLSDASPEGFCPWCGRSLANGKLVEKEA